MVSEPCSFMLTEIAATDLDEIYEYLIFELQNSDAAAAFGDELEEKLAEICKMPKSGRLVKNNYLRRKDVRRALVKNFVMYYIFDEPAHQVIVLRIVYHKRNQDKILKEME